MDEQVVIRPGAAVEDPQSVRLGVYESYRELFASAPIRLMSRTVSEMRSLGYDDLATAIGDLDWRTVPENDPVDPDLHHDWQSMLCAAFEHTASWIGQLGAHPMGYNLDSVGYPAVIRAWAGMWQRQLGLEFSNRPHQSPEVYILHGGNQAVQASLLGVAEAHRERVGAATPATILVPVPTFTCPLDQIALQGLRAVLMPPTRSDADPSPQDLRQVPDGTDVDAVYVMPINNPTGRTLEADRMQAFLSAVLDRWPHAGLILDSVYIRLHPDHRQLMSWYTADPRFADAVLFIDSLSKTHGVTGLRSGAILTRSTHLRAGVTRYCQNIMAGPSNVMQATALSMLAPFLTGDGELAEQRVRLAVRIGRHLQRRRRLLLEQAFASWGELLDDHQPLLPDPDTYDWQGSMYAVLRLSDRCVELAARRGVPPTVGFYLETGIGGVPLDGFCRNRNLERHGLLVNAGQPELDAFQAEASRYVRLSYGMTPPPTP
jgi:aspartate/methionine/tyrosine aminotransferase